LHSEAGFCIFELCLFIGYVRKRQFLVFPAIGRQKRFLFAVVAYVQKNKMVL